MIGKSLVDRFIANKMVNQRIKYTQHPFAPSVTFVNILSWQSVSEGNHTSPDGRFVVELNDGKQWILYSSDHDLEFVYSPAAPNEPYR